MWEERISRSTHPAIMLEHVLRYRMAMPVVNAGPVWADLGCGAGVAAAHALENTYDGRTMLVDSDQSSLDAAREELTPRIEDIVTLTADLASKDDLARLATDLGSGPSGPEGCITCFEVVEHLANFVPLMDLLKDLAGLGYTAILSVPNDSFWSLENPHHQTVWGSESFAELCQLLPEPYVVAHQSPVVGSCILVTGEGEHRLDLQVPLSADSVPSHYIVAFGPKANLITTSGNARQGELERQRSWERQREAHLTYLEQREEDLMWLLNQSEAKLADVEGIAKSNGEGSRTATDSSS